ncbi:MAG: 50S ribosomal protein L29 [archaeon]
MTKEVKKYRELGLQELEAKVIELKTELARSKALNASGTKNESPGKINKTRKSIARTLTIIKERNSGGKK